MSGASLTAYWMLQSEKEERYLRLAESLATIDDVVETARIEVEMIRLRADLGYTPEVVR